MFDPDAHMARINRGMIYLGAWLIAGIRLAREREVNVCVVPTSKVIEESVDLAYRFPIGCSGKRSDPRCESASICQCARQGEPSS